MSKSGINQVLEAHTSDVTWVDFCGTKLLVSASNDKTIRLWQVDGSGCFSEAGLSPLMGHTYGVNCVRFSPFGTIIASCSTDGKIILWNANTGEQVVLLQHPSKCAVRVCNFSPSSALMATGGDDECLVIWDISTRSIIRSLEDHEAMITACAFSPDSAYLISASTAGDLKLWDSKCGHGKCLNTYPEAHDLGVLGCDFSSQYQVNVSNGPLQSFYLFASCGNDDLVKLWHIRGGLRCSITLSHSLRGHSANVNCCKFSTDGSLLASASGDKTVIIWNPNLGTLLHKLEGHNRYVTCCVFSSDNRVLATGSNDKTVILWPLEKILGGIAATNGPEITETILRPVTASKTISRSSANSVSEWSVNDVTKWLERLGLERYSDVFRENEIDGSELLHLTHDSLLTSFKIDALGHRSKILRGVQALRNPLWQHVALNEEDNAEMPEELYCPITHEFMQDPVVAADGYSYERQAIAEWFESGNSTSPMTNEPMEHRTLIPNVTLRLLIKKYLTPASV